MTTPEKIAAIREKCIEANPSIMELGFGCEITPKKTEENYVGEEYEKRICIGNEWFVKKGFENVKLSDSTILHSFNILGRKIGLCDVLLAIRGDKEKLMYEHLKPIGELLGQYWNLLQDDLTLQSPPTIDFLYDLLK